MKYLVTGADGFLGRHFLAQLAQRGIETKAMLIEGLPEVSLPGNPEIVRGDLLNAESLAGVVDGVTHVVHLAARVHMMNDPAPDPEKAFFRVNVDGTKLLLQAARDGGVSHFLLMSTVKAMGEEDSGVFDENTPPKPTTPYGRSKLAAEKCVFEFGRENAMHTVALRLPMVYGPGAKGNVLRLLDAASKGRKLPFGAIRNQRSMVYVGNVVDAAIAALDHAESDGRVYLVCDAKPYGTRDIYSEICRSMGKGELLKNTPAWMLKMMGLCGDVLEFITRRDMPVNSGVIGRIAGDLCFSSDRISSELGFVPQVALPEGINRTVEWYQQGCPPTPPAQ